MKKQSRRIFIKSAGANLLLPLSTPLIAKTSNTSLNTFVVPPLDEGVRDGNKVRFKLTAQTGKTEFFKGKKKTLTAGLNQGHMGPVLRNASPMAHPFHVHNVQFRILDRNGKRPHPTESGLKDVVLVHGMEKVRIIMKFPEYSDAKIPYMYHCHILEHEDQGMMGQFTVV